MKRFFNWKELKIVLVILAIYFAFLAVIACGSMPRHTTIKATAHENSVTYTIEDYEAMGYAVLDLNTK